jgi:hypothetical protein
MTANDRLSRGRGRLDGLDLLAATAIFVAYTALLLATTQMGFTRDESFYFHAARDYVGWFNELEDNVEIGRWGDSFTQEGIDRHWGYNPEHPVLMKTLFGLSYEHLHERLGWLGPSTAMRFPAMVFAALLFSGIYLFTREAFASRVAAVAAVALMALQPRFFFHAHMTCFDVPIVTVWFWTVYAYWRSLDSTRWAIATGLLWGIGLITKLNAFFLPAIFLLHWAIGGARKFAWRDGRLHVPTVPLALFAMAVLGPLVFYFGWPRHWYDTFGRIVWYLKFHMHHEHYFVAYFGQNLIRPPFPVAFPFVLTVVSIPLAVLAPMLAGGVLCLWEWVRGWRAWGLLDGDRYGTGALIAMNIALPILVIANPDTPVFGGVKHWFPSLPYLAMLGGYAISRVIAGVGAGLPARSAAALACVAAVGGPGALAIARNHPFGTSYFSEPIGGITGAADAGMMRQYWGYAARQALPWLNEHAPRGSTVYLVDTTGIAWDMYVEEGLVRPDLRAAWDPRYADFALYDHDKAFFHEQSEIWRGFGTYAPAHVVASAGVPIISVYARPGVLDPDDDGPVDPVEGSGQIDIGLHGSGSAGHEGAAEGSGDTADPATDAGGDGEARDREARDDDAGTAPDNDAASASGDDAAAP